MGLWSGIKYALNSTLGTKDFQPLDKIIQKLFVEEYHVIASEDEYYVFPKVTQEYDIVGVGSEFVIQFPYKFYATRNGYLNISGGAFLQDTYNHDNYFYLIVKENTETLINEYVTNESYNGAKFDNIRIDIKAGNEYSFFIRIKKEKEINEYYDGHLTFQNYEWKLMGKAVPSAIDVEGVK